MKANTKKAGKTPRPTSQDSATGLHRTELLGLDEAVSLLRTTRPTFYRWLRSGKIQGMKLGRQWRFRKDDIERFLSRPVEPRKLTAPLQTPPGDPIGSN